MNFLRKLLGKAPAVKITPEQNPQLYMAVVVDQLIRKHKIEKAVLSLEEDGEGVNLLFPEPEPFDEFDAIPKLTITYRPPGSGTYKSDAATENHNGKWDVYGHYENVPNAFPMLWPSDWSVSETIEANDTKSLVEWIKLFDKTSIYELTQMYDKDEMADEFAGM